MMCVMLLRAAYKGPLEMCDECLCNELDVRDKVVRSTEYSGPSIRRGSYGERTSDPLV